MEWKGLAALVGGLTIWYSLTGQPPNYSSSNKRYPLPQEIKVVQTTFPYETRFKEGYVPSLDGNIDDSKLEKYIRPAELDFFGKFEIETERYKLVKDEDYWWSRGIGWVNSLFQKAFFWDYGAGQGLKEDNVRAVLGMLENNEEIKDVTVRLNHNEMWEDWYRMLFSDEKLKKRNNWVARWTMGNFSSFEHELFAELARGDYYNSLTKTVVLYSDIPSISAHELGHHKDFSQFSSDWEYSLLRYIFPVMPLGVLHQEAVASFNAKDIMQQGEIDNKKDDWQFNRYLIPAFFTYLLASYGAVKKTYGKLFN